MTHKYAFTLNREFWGFIVARDVAMSIALYNTGTVDDDLYQWLEQRHGISYAFADVQDREPLARVNVYHGSNYIGYIQIIEL